MYFSLFCSIGRAGPADISVDADCSGLNGCQTPEMAMLEQPPKMKSPNSKTEIRKPRYVFSLRISDFMLGIFAGRLPLAGFCGAVLLVSGCVTTGPLDWVRNGFKVGPNYARPPAPVADEWIEAKNPNVQNRHLQDWWRVF